VTATLTLADAQVRLGSAAAIVSEAGLRPCCQCCWTLRPLYLNRGLCHQRRHRRGGQRLLGSSGTLTFTPGMTQTILSVPIVSDTAHEVDETIEAALVGAAGATLAAPMTSTVTNTRR